MVASPPRRQTVEVDVREQTSLRLLDHVDALVEPPVMDNGVGRPVQAASGSKGAQPHKSMGMQITKDRLALINREEAGEKIAFSIEDLIDDSGKASGTRVNLSIKFQQAYGLEEGSFLS